MVNTKEYNKVWGTEDGVNNPWPLQNSEEQNEVLTIINLKV